MLKDKDTNLETITHLHSVSFEKSGQIVGNQWLLREDGTMLWTPGPQAEDDTFAIVFTGNVTKYLVGHMEEEDMMVRTREAALVGLEERNCLKAPVVQPFGSSFDFDLQIKSPIKATVAKLVRFFELVADETVPLDKSFSASSEQVEKGSHKIVQLGKRESYFYHARTSDGECKVVFEGNFNEDDTWPQGMGTLKVLSNIRRKDVFSATNATEHDDVDDGNLETSGTRNSTLSAADLEKARFFNEQFLPLDGLPIPIGRHSSNKKISIIRGHFSDGLLRGLVRVHYTDGSTREGFAVSGAFHGLVRDLAPPFNRGKRKRYVKRLVENVVISAGEMMSHFGSKDARATDNPMTL